MYKAGAICRVAEKAKGCALRKKEMGSAEEGVSKRREARSMGVIGGRGRDEEAETRKQRQAG